LWQVVHKYHFTKSQEKPHSVSKRKKEGEASKTYLRSEYPQIQINIAKMHAVAPSLLLFLHFTPFGGKLAHPSHDGHDGLDGHGGYGGHGCHDQACTSHLSAAGQICFKKNGFWNGYEGYAGCDVHADPNGHYDTDGHDDPDGHDDHDGHNGYNGHNSHDARVNSMRPSLRNLTKSCILNLFFQPKCLKQLKVYCL